LVKPSSRKYRGYYRRVCRRIFDVIGDSYRHRGSGESTFGSLTNQYGERLKNTNSPHNKNTHKNNRSN